MSASVQTTLLGGVLRSPFAHARIRRLDTKKAEDIPGVRAIVSAEDFPAVASGWQRESLDAHGNALLRNLVARGKVYYEGQPILAIAADDEETLQTALDAVEIEYSLLPHVVDVQKAMDPEAALLHEDLFTKGIKPAPTQASNIARRQEALRGAVGDELARADVIVTEEFTTAAVQPAGILLPFCQAVPKPSGQYDVHCHRILPALSRSLIAAMTDIPEEDVDYNESVAETQDTLFADHMVYLEPFALLLAKKAQSTVSMQMSREDVFRATAAGPGCYLTLRLGSDRQGKLMGAEVVVCMQAGAFPGAPLGQAIEALLANYHLPAYRVIAYDVVVNRPMVSGCQELASAAVCFALESLLDEMARKLSICPLELRSLNAQQVPLPRSISQQPDQQVSDLLQAMKSHECFSTELVECQGRGIALGSCISERGDLLSYCLHVCDLEMDEGTGEVKILRYSLVPLAVNERVCEALASSGYQIQCKVQAAVTAGLGRALSEACLFDEHGKLSNVSFLDYRLPLACDLPPIVVDWSDIAHFANSGSENLTFSVGDNLARSSMLPPLAAVANAIADATSARITSLPMSPPLVLAETQRQKWKRRRRR